MNNFMDEYKKWITDPNIDEETKKELKDIQDNEEEIKDRFYSNLEFGTAGLRGIIGAGTNRMNKYVISKTNQGLANFILSKGKEAADRGVVIAYDVRHYSKEFALTSALVLAANGIKTYLFKDIATTPLLSFSVRRLNTISGIVVTASHNPKNYNGYKLYWDKGSQILDDIGIPVSEEINKIKSLDQVKIISEKEAIDKNLLVYLDDKLLNEYLDTIKKLSLNNKDVDKNIIVVYSPLNGTGNIPVRRILDEMNYRNVYVVPEQEKPDPNFTTAPYPNPEDPKAFELAEKVGENVDADILIATDPDCDRLAVEVKNNKDEYIFINGNQTAAIMLYYILNSLKEQDKLKKNSIIIKSIVTGDLGKVIAEDFGVKTFETLTGFKNICGLLNEIENEYTFVFGYEESIGYTYGTHVRDKDAVISSLILAEAAAYYKKQQKTLLDILEEIYEKYGYYFEENYSLVLKGIEGKERIDRIMISFRENLIKSIDNLKTKRVADYKEQKIINLPSNSEEELNTSKSNVLRYWLEDGSWFAIRPSGTEPKLKIYIYSFGKTRKESNNKLVNIRNSIDNLIEKIK